MNTFYKINLKKYEIFDKNIKQSILYKQICFSFDLFKEVIINIEEPLKLKWMKCGFMGIIFKKL